MGDELFSSLDKPAGAAEKDANPAEGSPSGPSTYTLTEEQWAAMQARDEAQRTALAEATAALSETGRALSAPPKAVVQDLPKDAREAVDVFVKDPSHFVERLADGRITDAVNNQLAPLLAPIIDSAHQSTVGMLRGEFDTQYGAGAFDEIVKPDLDKVVKSWNDSGQSAMLASREAMRSHVNRIKGEKIDAITEARGKFQESQAKAKSDNAREIISTLPPGSIPTARNAPVAADDKSLAEYIATVGRETGRKIDPERFVKVGAVKTASEYRAATAPAKS